MNPFATVIQKMVEAQQQTVQALTQVIQCNEQLIQLIQSLPSEQIVPASKEVAATTETKLTDTIEQFNKIQSQLSASIEQSKRNLVNEESPDSTDNQKDLAKEASDLWKGVQKVLKDYFTASEYELWIKDLIPVSVKDDTLFLRSESELRVSRVREKYIPKIEKALTEVSPTVNKVKILNPLS